MEPMIVCIEGPDGTGKSTQIRKLQERLSLVNDSRIQTFPANSVLYQIIRRMLKTGSAKKWKNVFQTLFLIDRILFQIKFLFQKKSEYVILDRWKASGFAYGTAEGVWWPLLALGNVLTFNPDLTIILTGGAKRNVSKGDYYDTDKALQKKVSTNYLIYSLTSQSPVKLVENNFGIDSAAEEIYQLVMGNDLE